jgi:Flp pilus assembly protein CpaB
MKRGSRILLFLVVVIIILVAVAFLVLGRVGNPFAKAPTPTPPWVSIVIVGQPINRDDQIKQESLSSMQMPQTSVTGKMVTDPKTVVGKYAIYPLTQGLPITTDMVSDRPGMNQPGSEAAKIISPGLVAISIPISWLSSMSYGIRDGDRVNVIATTLFIDVDATFQTSLPNLTAQVTGVGFIPDALPVLTASISGAGAKQGRAEADPTLNQALYLLPSEEQRPRLVSQMILQDIQVLHVGDFILSGQEPQKAVEGQPTPTPAPLAKPKAITLIVSPQDAVALTYLIYSGTKFTLTLRAPDDTTRVETEAATLQYLLSQYAIPVPAKLPYVMEPRIVAPLAEPGTVLPVAAP